MDVIFYEAFKEEEEALKQYLPVGVQAAFTSQTIQEAQDKTPPAKLISVRTQSQIPLEWADQIEGILTRSQGYDHLLEYLKQCGKKIPCGYLEGYCSVAVAEHAIGLMFSMYRKFDVQIESAKNGTWMAGVTGDRGEFHTLVGKKVGIIGLGRIGSRVAKRLAGWECEIVYYDVVEHDDEYVAATGATKVDLVLVSSSKHILRLQFHDQANKSRCVGFSLDVEFSLERFPLVRVQVN